MASVASPMVTRTAERLWTIAELAELPDETESGMPVRHELERGRLISEMAPLADEHGAVESNLITQIKVQGELRGFGKARSGDVGIIIGRNPDTVYGADAVFITNASLPLRLSKEGYLETPPELVVEVRSKGDRRGRIAEKVDGYLGAGVEVVWIAEPAKKRVVEHRRGAKPVVYGEDDVLTVEDVIPGFRMPVRDVFVE